MTTATDEESRARLHLLGMAFDLPERRLTSRECTRGDHRKCEGHAQAGRLHPMLQHQPGKGATYDQPLPCFCDCHELFRPR